MSVRQINEAKSALPSSAEGCIDLVLFVSDFCLCCAQVFAVAKMTLPSV